MKIKRFIRKPGIKGIQENFYKEGRKAGKLFSSIQNAGVFQPGNAMDLKKDLSDFHIVDPQIRLSVDIGFIRKGSIKI